MTTVEIVALAVGGFVAYAASCGIALRLLKAAGVGGDPEMLAMFWPVMVALIAVGAALVIPVWLGSRIALGTAALPGVISRRLARRRCTCTTDVTWGRLEPPDCPRHGVALPEARTVQR